MRSNSQNQTNYFGQKSVIPYIIALNAVVYVAWVLAGKNEMRVDFMSAHFLVSWQALTEGRLWTLLTSAFSHNLSWHFILNMFVLNSFGRITELTIGRRRFIQFYLVAAIVSSFGHAFVSNYFLNEPELPALGASGAISAVILLFSLFYPREKILILGLIPLPALTGALVFVGLDIWGLFSQIEGGGLPIGHGAHLGGALTGVVYFFWLRRQMRAQFRRQIDNE